MEEEVIEDNENTQELDESEEIEAYSDEDDTEASIEETEEVESTNYTETLDNIYQELQTQTIQLQNVNTYIDKSNYYTNGCYLLLIIILVLLVFKRS